MAGDLLIPPTLARTAVAWAGPAGHAWLDQLPRVIAELSAAWDLEVGSPFLPGGQISWVAPVRRRVDGGDAVLKVQLPHPESAPEASALRAWQGGGAVGLLDHDAERCGLLLERCHPGEDLLTIGGDAAAAIGASLAARLHQVAAPDGVPSLAAVLDRWADELQDRLEVVAPPDPGLGRLAVEIMRTGPSQSRRQVLLHGDLNPTNVISAGREPWLAIDPKPMVGDPAHDGARLVTQPDPNRSADPSRTVERRLATVADALGVARATLAAWCLADVVEMATAARVNGEPTEADRLDLLVGLVGGVLR